MSQGEFSGLNNDNNSERTSMSSVSVRSDDAQIIKPDEDDGDRKHVPVAWFIRLGRGIRGL